MQAHPSGQFVAEAEDGKLLGAMYSQRVPSYKSLLTCQRLTELSLHVSDGPVIQLLGVVQRRDGPSLPGGSSVGARAR